MVKNIIGKILGSANDRLVKSYDKTVSLINDLEPKYHVMSDDEYVLINVDAESYYPSMMIQFQTLSRSIPDPQMFDDILQERFAIKHKPNKTKDDDQLWSSSFVFYYIPCLSAHICFF